MSTNEYTEKKDDLLTLDEAAKLLKVHPATIRRRIKKDKIPGAVIRPVEGVLGVRERYFIPRSALQTPFEVTDVVPVEHGLSVDDFRVAIDTHLRTQLSRQRQSIKEDIEKALTEQAQRQDQREQQTSEALKTLEQTFKERLEQQDNYIKELTAQIEILNTPRSLRERLFGRKKEKQND